MIDKKSRQVRGGSRNLLKVAKDGDFEKVMFMLIDGLDPNVAQDDGPKGEKKVGQKLVEFPTKLLTSVLKFHLISLHSELGRIALV